MMKNVNGTCYHKQTPDKVVQILENARVGRTRIRVDYGNTETGESWGDTLDVEGYIGRSNGAVKIPLLVYNSRSLGGPALMDHCIIRIETTKGKRCLYEHPFYSPYIPQQ